MNTKQTFAMCANTYTNVKQCEDIELCDTYNNTHDEALKNACLAELLLRCWKLVPTYIQKSYSLGADEDMVVDWLFDAVLYAVSSRVWSDEHHMFHNDPKAFQKVVSKCMYCSRLTAYQFSNRHKRKLNHDAASIDELKEKYSDTIVGDYIEDEYNVTEINTLIKDYFNKKDYFKAFFIHGAIWEDVFKKGVYCDAKMKTYLLHLDRCVDTFAMLYGFDRNLVMKASQYVIDLGYGKIDYKLKYHRNELMRQFR